jgi:hypothetical protein
LLRAWASNSSNFAIFNNLLLVAFRFSQAPNYLKGLGTHLSTFAKKLLVLRRRGRPGRLEEPADQVRVCLLLPTTHHREHIRLTQDQ